MVRYAGLPQLQEISESLQGDGGTWTWLQSAGDHYLFVLAALFRKTERATLLVCAEYEEADYAYTTLSQLLPAEQVGFFPVSFTRPGFFDRSDAENTLRRTETVQALALPGLTGKLVVTYPEALFEQVVRPEALAKNKIEIAKGNNLDLDFLLEFLVMYGFERVEDVYEPGQFAIRGGIVDVFSFAHEQPYRIELFDEEVVSIRLFDPATQLSVQQLSMVRIVPNMKAHFGREERVILPDVFAEKSLLVVRDWQILCDRLQLCFERLEGFKPKSRSQGLEHLHALLEAGHFARPSAVISALENFNTVFLDKQAHGAPASKPIKFNCRPQPSFNKNFQLFIANLHENVSGGLTNLLFTDNTRQIDRLRAIFKDLNAQVAWQPLSCDLHAGFIDQDLQIACYTDHQIFDRYHASKRRKGYAAHSALSLQALQDLKPGDFVTHIDHGIGRFSGLEKIEIGGQLQEAVRLVYRNNDLLYVSIYSLHKIARYRGPDGQEPQLNKLGSDTWANTKKQTKRKVKELAIELIQLYAKRKATPGHPFPPDGYLQNEMEASFMYVDTPDQFTATQDVKADMEKPHPMDRLVCGDVGFGKTEVAIRAAFKAVSNGKQVALLCPTTFLSRQHYNTFVKRLEGFDVVVDHLSRLRTAKERTLLLKRVASGEIDILIGTHALLTKDLQFKDLGLLVIDEEQKFGVGAKEKLRSLRVNVDTLTLTATPIPRTLQFSLMAARDLSVMRTPPPNRQPIHTEVAMFREELVKEVIDLEIARNGQVFFVHNRVAALPDIAAMIRTWCPQARVAFAHGQMKADHMDAVLTDFVAGEYDVLVSTNIIETGLDISNANTMLINNAHQFGLSDLHQLRGRVGRSNRKAYCYLLCPPLTTLPADTRKRLRTLEEFTDLGSGFYISMRDLDIRGAGNLLGAEQSGFVADIGFETYQKILEEAIQELKEDDFKDLFADEPKKPQTFVRETAFETDIEMFIPNDYIEQSDRRLSIYSQMSRLQTDEEIEAFAAMLTDRYGRLPAPLTAIFEGIKLRRLARTLGFDKLVLKNNKLVCHFVSNPQSPYYESDIFKKIFTQVSTLAKNNKKPAQLQFELKQTPRAMMLERAHVQTMAGAYKLLETIQSWV
jgi:transcription-repair coupling factor (superfamily II helicase)